MAYSFSTLDDGRILLLLLEADYDLDAEMSSSSLEVSAYLDQAAQTVILITDARAVQINDLNKLISSAQNIKRPEVKASVTHPKLLKYFSVIDNRLVTAAVRGLNSATFGYFAATLFDSMDAAIAQARVVLAAETSQE